MAAKELEAGKRWVEQRFEEIAREFGAPRTLAQEDRWREAGEPFMKNTHYMTYYIELHGHVRRGEIAFWDIDLEDAGAGEKEAQEQLESQMRYAFRSLGS